LKLNTGELFPILEIANEFLKTYKLISNNEFNFFIRMYSEGNNKINFIINNFDTKIKFNFETENDLKFDKMYFIEEFYNIIKGMKIYNDMIFNPEINSIDFGTDAKFFLSEHEMEDKIKLAVYADDELEIGEVKTSELNNFIKAELGKIKTVLGLKNNKYPNYYSYVENDIVFNFYNVYAKKINSLKLINSDIIGLCFLVYIFSKYENLEFSYGINDSKYIFKSDNFYIEGRNIILEEEKVGIINSFFSSFKEISKVELKLEFYNFLSTVVAADKNIYIVFDDNKVRLQANAEHDDNNAEFKVNNDFKGFFLLNGCLLNKVLSFVLKYQDKIDQFVFSLGESIGNNRWLKIIAGDTEIMLEITADLDNVENTDEGDEAEEIFNDE
jgi:hypothetical protein